MSHADFDPRDRADTRLTPTVFDGKKWSYEPICGDRAPDRIRFMARSGGYVMVRKPRCVPFVLSEKQWAKLPLYDASLTQDGRS